MRYLGLALLLFAGGCFGGDAPPALTSGDGGNLSDLLGVEDDMPVVIDMAKDAGSTTCVTACDCQPGDECRAGMCHTGNVLVYCCGAPTCTGSNVCQQPDGKIGQCGLSPDASFSLNDLGTTTGCMQHHCTPGAGGDTLCKLACGSLAATCTPGAASGSGGHCSP